MNEKRICNRCNTEKTIDNFQRVGIRNYRRRNCKECIASYHHALYFGDIKPIDRGANERKCRRCGEVKSISEFPKLYGKYSEKGWQKHTCKICDNKDHAARESRRRKRLGERYREKNRVRNRESAKKTAETKKLKRLELKCEVMMKYGGLMCVCCKETCITMLTLDHINNDGAQHRKEISGTRKNTNMYFYLKQNDYPPGFQVLCYNCNISKYRNNFVCEHHFNEGPETIPQGSTLK